MMQPVTAVNPIFSPAFLRHPWTIYRDLRKHKLPCYFPQDGLCVLTQYTEVRNALTSHWVSSSPPAACLHSVLGTTFRDVDGVGHQRLRHAFLAPYRRKTVDSLAPAIIDPVVESVIEGVVKNGGGDFVTDVAYPLAINVACRTIGIPESDGPHLFHLTLKLMETMGEGAVLDETFNEIRDYFLELLQGNPCPNTLLAHLTTQDVVHKDDVVRNLILIFAASTKPMAAGISNTLLSVAQHPKAYAAAHRQPQALRAAINESLRLETPLDLITRYAKQDQIINGYNIREGTLLLLALASAHRDETVYRNANEWNPKRDTQKSLAFGLGHHVCLGRYLAMALLMRSVSALFQRVDGLRLTADTDLTISNPFVRIPKHLDLAISSYQ